MIASTVSGGRQRTMASDHASSVPEVPRRRSPTCFGMSVRCVHATQLHRTRGRRESIANRRPIQRQGFPSLGHASTEGRAQTEGQARCDPSWEKERGPPSNAPRFSTSAWKAAKSTPRSVVVVVTTSMVSMADRRSNSNQTIPTWTGDLSVGHLCPPSAPIPHQRKSGRFGCRRPKGCPYHQSYCPSTSLGVVRSMA